MSARRRLRPGSPDRTALASGLGGMALAAISAVPWAAVVARVSGAASTRAGWAQPVFTLVSVAGLCLAVLAIWSAIKAWLRDDVLTAPARWGLVLGFATMVLVVALGPCGPQGCPS